MRARALRRLGGRRRRARALTARQQHRRRRRRRWRCRRRRRDARLAPLDEVGVDARLYGVEREVLPAVPRLDGGERKPVLEQACELRPRLV